MEDVPWRYECCDEELIGISILCEMGSIVEGDCNIWIHYQCLSDEQQNDYQSQGSEDFKWWCGYHEHLLQKGDLFDENAVESGSNKENEPQDNAEEAMDEDLDENDGPSIQGVEPDEIKANAIDLSGENELDGNEADNDDDIIDDQLSGIFILFACIKIKITIQYRTNRV